MKTLFFTEKHIKDTVDFILEMNEIEKDEEGDDLITDFLAQKMNKVEVIDEFKNTVMIWFMYIRFCLIKQNYELAKKIKDIIKIEKRNAAKLIEVMGDAEESDDEIFDQIIKEVNYIINEKIDG